MKFHRTSATAATLLAGAVVLGLFIHQTASSDAKAEQAGKCSAQTLKGSYGLKFEGIKFADQNSATDRRFVSMSLITFDGRATFTTSETGRFEGELVSRTFTGPISLTPIAPGFSTFPPTCRTRRMKRMAISSSSTRARDFSCWTMRRAGRLAGSPESCNRCGAAKAAI